MHDSAGLEGELACRFFKDAPGAESGIELVIERVDRLSKPKRLLARHGEFEIGPIRVAAAGAE